MFIMGCRDSGMMPPSTSFRPIFPICPDTKITSLYITAYENGRLSAENPSDSIYTASFFELFSWAIHDDRENTDVVISARNFIK